MFEAEFTHEGDRCTFETLCARLGLKDSALHAVGEIVHDIDLKEEKFGRPETAGVARLLAGLARRTRDDRERIERGGQLFDDLYESFAKPGGGQRSQPRRALLLRCRRAPGADVDRGGNMTVFSRLRDRSARARLIGALVVWLAGGSAAAEEVPAMTVLDFEDATVGALPSGFSIALTGGGGPVAWAIQEDASSAAGSKVLVQTSRDETSKRFPLCVYEPFSARDVDLAVRFKPISGKVDQAAGLVFRYRDSSNYYIVRANALEGNVVLYKVEDGKRSDLKPVDGGLFAYGKKAPVPGQTWGVLRVVARGDRFSVHLDGNHLFDVEDATFSDAGRVGLWTKADSVTAFDELRIENLDGAGR